ncbi:MAG: hypothetical protein IID35_12175 [Planctomycetes bacterium]|nr:hypothetical protein [Planctomycetota bacterium]
MSAKPLTNRTTLKNDSAAVTVLPVARGRAFTRGLVWTVPAVLIAGTIFLVARPLNFSPTGTSNRIVDYSIALALIPFAIVGIAMAIKATSSLALAFWPVRLGVFLTEHGVRMRLGPLGVKSFDAARINVRYPFELIDEDDNGGFEAFLPEEEQMAEFLPRMLHPDASEPINRLILKFSMGTEAEVAAAFGPMIQQWRSNQEAKRA